MLSVSFRTKEGKAEWRKQKVTVTCLAVAIKKSLFGMCDCTIDSDVGTGNFSLVVGILQVCGHAHVRSHVSLGMNWTRYITERERERCYQIINRIVHCENNL